MEPHLTSTQVERVLRRASELAHRDGPDPVAEDGISERALLAAADEAGIPLAAVRRSLAIERLGEPVASTAGDRLVGPRVVSVDVELAMSVPEAMSRIDDWITRVHLLRRQRWSTYEAVWCRNDGVVAAASRAARSAMGEGALGQVERLTVLAREAGDGLVLRISVDRRQERAAWVAGGSVVGVAGVTASVAGAIAVAPVMVALAPVGLVVGAGVLRIGRTQSDVTVRHLQELAAAVAERRQPSTLGASLRQLLPSVTGRRRRR